MVCFRNIPKFLINFSEKDHGLSIFCQKQAQNRYLILTHHLKGLSLSFQKIIKMKAWKELF